MRIVICLYMSLCFVVPAGAKVPLCPEVMSKLLKSSKKVKAYFQTPVSRYLLMNTKQGKKMMADVLGIPSADISDESIFHFKRFLEETKIKTYKIAAIGGKLKKANAYVDLPDNIKLSDDQKKVLDHFSKYYMKMKNHRDQKEYFREVPDEVRSFFKTTKEDNIKMMDRMNALSPAKKRNLLFRGVDLFRDMKSCLKTMPKKELRKQTLKLALTQLGIAEVLTVGTYVAAADESGVDWANLPTDMFVAGVAAVVEPMLAMSGGSLFERYIKMVIFGGAKSGVEGAIFYYSPLTNANGHDPEDFAQARAGFSFAWAAASSAVKLGFFTTILGLQCLYPSYAMELTTTGLQFAFRVGSSYAYFKVRNITMDEWGYGAQSNNNSDELVETESASKDFISF